MRNYAILTDSTSDLEKSVREQYDIDYVPMGVVVNVGKENEEEIKADLDWGKYSFHELYQMMRDGVKMKTTAVPQNVFEDTFEKYVSEGKDVIYIACAGALSGSVNVATMVARDVMEKHPEAKIICIDSYCACCGEGMMVIEAAKQRAAGKTIDEVAEYTLSHRNNYNQFATVETLSYLKNAGRVKASAAFFGNIIGVKPIIISDVKGNNYAYVKVKGRKNSIDKLVADAKACLLDPNAVPEFWIAQADCMPDIDYLVNKIKADINAESIIHIVPMGPIIGVSTGPGTIGLYVFGKEVTIVGA